MRELHEVVRNYQNVYKVAKLFHHSLENQLQMKLN